MSDFATRITTLVDTKAPPIDVEELVGELESGTESGGTPPVRRQRRTTNWAVAVGAAIVVFVVVGGFVWLIGGTGSDVIDAPTSTTAATPTTISPDPTTVATAMIDVAGWNTVLADTEAKAPPAPATCPSSATPNLPGQSDQARPDARWVGNLAGAFDQRTGRVVYVDVTGETWTFDVCTNTWHQMNPNTRPASDEDLYDGAGQPSGVLGQLVYDIDSDLTISLGYGRVSVYDANTNLWTQRDDPPEGIGPLGAVYDPISGLVITSTYQGEEDWDLWTYDVDADTWTHLGTVVADRGTPCCTLIDLLGYAAITDTLILTTYVDSDEATILINPRTGDTNLVLTGEPTGIVNLVWPGGAYGPAGDTVYVYGHFGRFGTPGISRFDSATTRWILSEVPDGAPGIFSAVVGDPINNRLILINGAHGEWLSDATDDIWAIDLESGQWTQILAPSTP